jgi:uncharacterized protein
MGRLIFWLVDALILFFLIRTVMRLFGGARAAGRPPSAPQSFERAGGTLVRDPHCGTYVPVSRALEVRAGQQTLYFCSPACRDAFKQGA